MLTKQEMNQNAKDIIRDSSDIDALRTMSKVYLQATQAIDLAAENARLKAKLDAVREACYTTVAIQEPIQNKQIVESIRSILHRILAIIKDGDTDA